MSASHYQTFVKELNQLCAIERPGDVPKIALVFGESDYLLLKSSQAIAATWARILGGSVISLDADQVQAAQLPELLLQSSLFEPVSVVSVRRCEKKNEWLAGLKKSYPRIQNHLVLSFYSKKILAKIDAGIAHLKPVHLHVAEPGPHEIIRFVHSLAKRHALKLSDRATELMIDAIGTDLAKLDNEVQKLSLIFAGDAHKNQTMDAADVAPYLGLLREDAVFHMDDLLLSQKHAEAAAFLTSLLDKGASGIALLGVLSRHCRNALLATRERAPRSDLGEFCRLARLPPSVAKRYMHYAARKSPSLFARALQECAHADVVLKSSKKDQLVQLHRVMTALQGT